jgi:hypothetical protein
MGAFENTVTIHRTSDDIFAHLVEFENAPSGAT